MIKITDINLNKTYTPWSVYLKIFPALMKHSHSLVTMDFTYTMLETRGFQSLASVLENAQNLTELYLEGW